MAAERNGSSMDMYSMGHTRILHLIHFKEKFFRTNFYITLGMNTLGIIGIDMAMTMTYLVEVQ